MATTVTQKDINRLAIPAIIAGIAEPVISLADTAIIGRIGTTELAAVGLASSFYMLVIWVLSSIRSAAGSIVAQQIGRGDQKGIRSLVPQAVLMSALMGLVFLVLSNVFTVQIFKAYEASGMLLEQAVSYFKIRSFGFPLSMATFMLFGIFRGYQNTLLAMYISIAGGICNIILDFALIFGVGNVIPAMGVEGAAWATLMSQVLMLVLAVYMLLKHIGVRFSKKLHPQLKSLTTMSIDLILRTAALNIAYYLANRFSTMYGTTFIAAHTIAMNLWLFSAFFLDGYASAANALAGKLKGENNYAELYRVGKVVAKICLIASVVLAVVFTGGYKFWGSLFTTEAAVLKVFEMVFWLVILCQPINALAFTMDGVFKGTGDTRLLRDVLILSIGLGFVPVIYGTDYLGWHIYSVWTAFIIWMMFRAGFLMYKFRQKFGTELAVVQK